MIKKHCIQINQNYKICKVCESKDLENYNLKMFIVATFLDTFGPIRVATNMNFFNPFIHNVVKWPNIV